MKNMMRHGNSSSVDIPNEKTELTTSSSEPNSNNTESGKAATSGYVPPTSESLLSFQVSAALAFVYMFGCITFFLLIRYSKKQAADGGSGGYDNAAAVFFTELAKIIFSIAACYYRTGKFLPTSVIREGSWRTGIYYAIPSGIYAVYNNLTYFNLNLIDPGSYQVFMQTRILFTGVLFVQILKRPLTAQKWLGLIVLTLGVASKYFSWDGLQLSTASFYVLFQASLSALAGVVNEFLLKKDISMDVNEQNFFMYFFAIVFNYGYGVVTNPTYFTSGELIWKLNGIMGLIIINGAVVGIVTSLILKYINVIVKAFASACEVVLTGFLAWIFLGEQFGTRDVIAGLVVTIAIFIYYKPAPASS